MAYAKKPPPPPERGGPGHVPVGGGWEKEYPALFEYLTLVVWEDGTARQTSTLLLFFEDGAWKACLNDRENARSAWASGGSPHQAIRALEDALGDDLVEWRRRKDKPSRGR